MCTCCVSDNYFSQSHKFDSDSSIQGAEGTGKTEEKRRQVLLNHGEMYVW